MRRPVMLRVLLFALFALFALGLIPSPGPAQEIHIGSKSFTESYVLGEVAVRALEEAGMEASHRMGMGGTIILWRALLGGDVEAYPDYTGTIGEQILETGARLSFPRMRDSLRARGVGMTEPLGFDNTYALVMRRKKARELGIRTISDLADHPELRVGLTHEFMERRDGWRPLSRHYDLALDDVRGLEHALAYPALLRGDIDVMDAYSTDAKLEELDLVALTDDASFFPRYEAVFLFRLDMDGEARDVLEGLAGTLDREEMVHMNAVAEETGSYERAAGVYFGDEPDGEGEWRAVASRITGWTLRHLQLVAVSLLLAVLLGVPLGIRAARPGFLSQLILGGTGVIYTIPSLALLAVLVAVPFLGISTATAIVALFLYSLLPIVRNTATGLRSISPEIRESAEALGLEGGARLWKVYLPLASPTILAGVKTSAVINIATATLAALIGVGGLGEPILSGINLNDAGVILQGAVPAALLALLVQGLFELLERRVVPRGLR